MHRLDFKVFLGSAGIGRRQQASEGQRDTRVRVPGYGVADLSRRLNDAALIENSTPRSSPPLEAAAPALAGVTGLPPNPTRQAARLAATPHGTAPVPSRGAALSGHPHCGASFLCILFCSIPSIHISPSSRCSPFGDTCQRRQPPPGVASRGEGRPSVQPLCRRPARTAVQFPESGQRPERLHPVGAALLAPSRPRGSFSGDSGTGRGSVRLLYRLFGPRGSGHPEGQLTPHPHHTTPHRPGPAIQGSGHPAGQLCFLRLASPLRVVASPPPNAGEKISGKICIPSTSLTFPATAEALCRLRSFFQKNNKCLT